MTLSQRVLTTPLRMRLHYGHPDVFDKLFSMTRGGVSKASKVRAAAAAGAAAAAPSREHTVFLRCRGRSAATQQTEQQ